MHHRREFAKSANGDRWFLEKANEAGGLVVIHEANLASGGAVTKTEIATFLGTSPRHPQHLALFALIGTLVDDAAAAADS